MSKKLENVRTRVFLCLARDARNQEKNLQGALFRSVILHTEVGDVLDCVRKKEEGVEFSYKKDVELVLGQAGVQLLALMMLRKVWIYNNIDNEIRARLLFAKNEECISLAVRFGVMVSSLCKFITHDSDINPRARPHGTMLQEIHEFNEALICLAVLANALCVDFEQALEVGIANWEEADWQKREANPENSSSRLKGITALSGSATGMIWIRHREVIVSKLLTPIILVTSFAKPDVIAFDHLVTVISDHGGACCHMAVVARERSIPCIVGTGNATKILRQLHRKMAHITIEKDGTAIIALLPDATR